MTHLFHTTGRTVRNTQGGYSLVELIVYLAIFVGISVVLISSLVTSMRTYARAATYRNLQNNGELVMERIVREVRQASTITIGSSTFGSNPGVLALSGTDNGGITHTVTFDVSGSAVRVTDNSVTGSLTTSDVTATNVIFRRFTTAVGEGVKVELTLTTTTGTPIAASFYSTVLLRGR